MNKTTILLTLILSGISVQADNFDDLKEKLAQSRCSYFQFISVVESDIFDEVDSTAGTAYISSDGRYNITLGDEEYLFDSKHLYTYVKSNNQVIIEPSKEQSNDDILFITKLDDFYKSYILSPDLSYRLIRKEGVEGDFPDSLIVDLVKDKQQLEQIRYIDVNDELNRIIFLNQEYSPDCIESRFEPNYPDSVEKVKL